MKWRAFLLLLTILIATTASARVYVHGYHRKDGTYVAPHTRRNPTPHTFHAPRKLAPKAPRKRG